MDPPEDGPGRVAPSMVVTSAGTPRAARDGSRAVPRRPGPKLGLATRARVTRAASGAPIGKARVGILSNIPVASVVNDGGAGSDDRGSLRGRPSSATVARDAPRRRPRPPGGPISPARPCGSCGATPRRRPRDGVRGAAAGPGARRTPRRSRPARSRTRPRGGRARYARRFGARTGARGTARCVASLAPTASRMAGRLP